MFWSRHAASVRRITSKCSSLAPELADACGASLVLERLPHLRHLIYLEDGADAWWHELAAVHDASVRRCRSAALQEVSDLLQFDDPVDIQYTSGTTGSPKGATLSHHNILNNGFFVGEALRYTPDDRICTPVPFYHCFGCVMANLAALTHGAAVIVPAEAFDPEATLRADRDAPLHFDLRRADHVHRHARPCVLRSEFALRVASHRHHGGLAVPDRGDATSHRSHARVARSRFATA